MNYIKFFTEISKADFKDVGGKGTALGEMTKAGFPIPGGFVTTTLAYKHFLKQELPVDVIDQIIDAFEKIGVDRVAVRSSAVAEDSLSASWAGQLESYLNVTKESLIDNIRNCWNSIRSERALSYATEQGVNEEDLAVAVVIQKMVESDVSGVMFTVNPITKNQQEIMIEATYGLGEMLVQGLITPDNFLVDKNTLGIKERNIDIQDTMIIFKDGQNKVVPVPENKRSEASLNDDQIKKLAELAIKIENHYEKPQDIEWAIEKNNIFILQSRPVTTL